jgi:hypothetical protein
MAAFLRRLGRVLTPLVLRANDSATGQTYASPFVLCESTVVEPATPPYNRQASFTATVMNFNASATKTVQGRLVYSTSTPPAPPVWTPTGDAVMWQTVDPGERTTLALTGGPLDLAPSQHYQFAISLDTNAIGATVDAECQLNVRIDNRNSATSPL